MTRETKIGLLVGLAFIIVIGILLSDHFASTMQPPQASLFTATDNVLKSTVTPGAKQGAGSDLKVDTVKPNKQVGIGPGPNDGKAKVEVGPGDNVKKIIEIQGNPATDTAAKDADPGHTQAKGNEGNGDGDHEAVPAGMRQYTAEKGDNLSKIAAKLMGKNTKATRDAIIKANPSLQKNPDGITAGKTYLVPSKDGDSTTPNSGNSDTRTVLGPTTRPIGNDTVYTTKQGDNLWRIAIEQVGSSTAVAQIRELNKDVIKKGDSIQPGMKLRLPPKQMASAN